MCHCTVIPHIDAVKSKMKAERVKIYCKADLSKQKLNSLVSCSQHSYFGTCPFEGGGGGGVLAVKVCIIYNVYFVASSLQYDIWCPSEHSLFCLLISTGSGSNLV